MPVLLWAQKYKSVTTERRTDSGKTYRQGNKSVRLGLEKRQLLNEWEDGELAYSIWEMRATRVRWVSTWATPETSGRELQTGSVK